MRVYVCERENQRDNQNQKERPTQMGSYSQTQRNKQSRVKSFKDHSTEKNVRHPNK